MAIVRVLKPDCIRLFGIWDEEAIGMSQMATDIQLDQMVVAGFDKRRCLEPSAHSPDTDSNL